MAMTRKLAGMTYELGSEEATPERRSHLLEERGTKWVR
jgi:hypothetical protein